MPVRAFGRYRVLGRLATGGMASIFLARETTPQGPRLVCIKILLPERARDDDLVAMFLDEGKLASRLDHDNCVRIFAQGRERGVPYLAMEYIAGVTLWELIESYARRREQTPASAIASVVAATCFGLHHAHELKSPEGHHYNLVHRDVSPENIMVTFGGHTKLLDFGVVKAETSRPGTQTGIIKGKYSYMSPEQITGGRIDRRSDVFALGVVLFEALTARGLFRADTPNEIAALVLRKLIPRLGPLNQGVDDELEAIVNRALARPPSTRFQTAEEMGHALMGWLDRSADESGPSLLSRVLDRRFHDKVEPRRAVCQAALEGDYDEGKLLDVLGARPVFDVDLFGGPFSGDVQTLTDMEEEAVRRGADGAAGQAEGEGWRVDVQPATQPPQGVLRPASVPAMGGASAPQSSVGHYDTVAGADTVLDEDTDAVLEADVRAAVARASLPSMDPVPSEAAAALALAQSASNEQVGHDPADLQAPLSDPEVSPPQAAGFVARGRGSPRPKFVPPEAPVAQMHREVSTTASEVPVATLGGQEDGARRRRRWRTAMIVLASGLVFGVALGLFMTWSMVALVSPGR